MKKELQIFYTALMFYTRIPSPMNLGYSKDLMQKSIRYLSLIGLIVGGIGAMVFYFSAYIFPLSISILLCMGATIFVTGGFHEDGLADTFDGFGGGYTKEQVFRIMKDSNVGTYGVLALILILGLKFCFLYNIKPEKTPLVLLSGHALSRFATSSILSRLPYVKREESKVSSASGQMGFISLLVSAVFGIAPLFLLGSNIVFWTLIPVFITTLLLSVYFKKRIGGVTGDCLGASQQICEIVFYATLVGIA